MQENTRQKGSSYEKVAERYLIKKGYKILQKNFNALKYGEIDIISEYRGTIVFIEVKGRRNFKFGKGENSITNTKKQRIINSCLYWVMINNIDQDWRIDVIVIDHIEKSYSKMLKLRHYINCITQNI